MQFLLIIAHDDAFRPSAELVAGIHQWVSEVADRGVRIHGNPLCPADTAITVRVRSGRPQLSATTFSDSREQICAYELVECSDREEAIALALKHPMVSAATIEVREVWSDLQR